MTLSFQLIVQWTVVVMGNDKQNNKKVHISMSCNGGNWEKMNNLR